MSSCPDKMSSYRRQFESAVMDMPAVYQIPLCSASLTGQENHHQSASLARRERKGLSESASVRALCMTGPKLDLDVVSAENRAFMMTRTGERRDMIALNDRLAVYIEKVRTLESKNKMLEAEIEALKTQRVRPSGLRQLYEGQLKDLNRAADQIRVQRDSSLAAKEAVLGQLDQLKTKYEETVEARKKAESEIDNLRPVVDKTTSARLSLEKQLENLEMELKFLQRVHKEEIEELLQKLETTTSKIDLAFGVPDLTSALRQIHSHYDCIAAKNLQEMDTWYKTKFQDLSHASAKRAHGVLGLREEMASCKKDILNKERELDALRTRNAQLETRIRDSLENYKKKEEDLQERIEALKQDLTATKEKIALHLRQYQNLLNVKMALEIEITTYRKLIEGEDHRLSTIVHSMTPGSCAISSMVALSDSAIYALEDSEKPTMQDENIEDVMVEVEEKDQKVYNNEADGNVWLKEEKYQVDEKIQKEVKAEEIDEDETHGNFGLEEEKIQADEKIQEEVKSEGDEKVKEDETDGNAWLKEEKIKVDEKIHEEIKAEGEEKVDGDWKAPSVSEALTEEQSLTDIQTDGKKHENLETSETKTLLIRTDQMESTSESATQEQSLT